MTKIILDFDSCLEKKIREVSAKHEISESELIHQSVVEYLEKINKPSPWELGKDLFGKYGSNQADLDRDRKVLLKQKLKLKSS